jgi:AcrR family transcriptional regulator
MADLTDAPKRIRRTAEEAKRVILDAAEKLMSNSGPGGLRLQDVAAEVGLTHPVILHHFGSREGLIRALNERILDDLRQRLLAIFSSYDKPSADIVDKLLDSVFAVFRGGLGQRLAWLGADAVPVDDPPAAIFRRFVEGINHQRFEVLPGDADAGQPDSTMIVYLVATAALGDAVFGTELLGTTPGRETERARQRFRAWLSRLLRTHLVTYTDEPFDDLPEDS